MKICVCGYYYKPEFFKMMNHIKDKYDIHVVANKTWVNGEVPASIPVTKRENRGLEWGAYDFYLKNIWDGESDVLFSHDDVRYRPVIKNYEMIDPIKVFSTIEKLDYDQVYFFHSLRHAEKNYYIHGRSFKCSGRFLKELYDAGGFPYDENNENHIKGPTPEHCKHFNWADYEFAEFIKKNLQGKPGWKVGDHVILAAQECATRGRFDDEIDGPMEEDD